MCMVTEPAFYSLTQVAFFFLLHLASPSAQLSSLRTKESELPPGSVLRDGPCFRPLLPQAGCSLCPGLWPRIYPAGWFPRLRSCLLSFYPCSCFDFLLHPVHAVCLVQTQSLVQPKLSLAPSIPSPATHPWLITTTVFSKTHMPGLFLLSSKEAHNDGTHNPSWRT